ncbi:MAG: mevalonate kinase [Candidatus Peribacteraceae bacterium]|nr:mevalonate kinase [Candidatus Peribacteraceae bacterium]
MSHVAAVSAPGKLVVLGDHAVVYGHPALVTAVGQRLRAEVTLLDDPVLELDAPDVGVTGYRKPLAQLGEGDIPKGAKSVELALRRFIAAHPIKGGMRVRTSSEFSASFGFGSSGASAVCVLGAAMQAAEGAIDRRRVFDLAYQSVKDAGSSGSGIDLAASAYGGLLYFVTGGKAIEPLTAAPPFLIGYTGVKVDTGTIVAEVKARADAYPAVIDGISRQITSLVEMAKAAAMKGDLRVFGDAMNFNQGLLESLGVGSTKLSQLIFAAREAGALGAKLSGAGKGDCMIALVTPERRAAVASAITAAGGTVIDIPCNAEGLRVES